MGFKITKRFKNGKKLLITEHSHVHGKILPFIDRAISQLEPNSGFIKETIQFDKPIGVTHCVKVSESDEIYYEVRGNRKQPSKMVRNRQPEPSNLLTLVICQQNKSYKLLTAYVGEQAEAEPWDENAFSRTECPQTAREKAISFWEQHALIAE